MATYAKILKDSSGNQILPYSRASLVYMDDNTTVETAINNIQSQGGYTLPTASAYTLGGVRIGSNINISNGAISIGNSEVTNALGYTPANDSAIKYRYYFSLPVDNWNSTSSNGYSYYQSYVYLYADNGGSTDLRNKKISAPMSIKTGNATTDETLQANLNIIADGYITCTSSGYVTVYTKKKPSSDITIYIEAN